MGQFLDIYSLIFIVIAVVIFIRLRGVLGRKTGNERPPADRLAARDRVEAPIDRRSDDNVIPLARPGAVIEPAIEAAAPTPNGDGSALNRAMQSIVSVDKSFDGEHFVAGAKAAYEMIVMAFAAGDRKALKDLLAKEVYDGFDRAIGQRESAGETVETKFVGIDKAEIFEASLKGSTAQVTVRFLSHLITATRDRAGVVIDGDASKVAEVVDVWTFARDVNSRDPNWKLVATQSAE